MTNPTPQYANPPVVETVLGIEFRPLVLWGTPHFGLFWTKIREKYPKFLIQPPIPNESTGPAGLTISFNPAPLVRCWFIDSDDQWLTQVQNSRFISNWRKRPDSAYPSYSLFRERFLEQYRIFQDFLLEEGLLETNLFQTEVSYINHVPIEEDFKELPKMFPIFSSFERGSFLPAPQSGGFNFVYPMPEDRGRLFINVQRVLNHETAEEILQFTVTAKTLVASDSETDALASLDFGHEWVVRGFTDFTSSKMHDIWEMRK